MKLFVKCALQLPLLTTAWARPRSFAKFGTWKACNYALLVGGKLYCLGLYAGDGETCSRIITVRPGYGAPPFNPRDRGCVRQASPAQFLGPFCPLEQHPRSLDNYPPRPLNSCLRRNWSWAPPRLQPSASRRHGSLFAKQGYAFRRPEKTSNKAAVCVRSISDHSTSTSFTGPRWPAAGRQSSNWPWQASCTNCDPTASFGAPREGRPSCF